MATYYHHGNSEIQSSDGLHTLYLMNPNNYLTTAYSADTQQVQQHPNLFLINPAAARSADSSDHDGGGGGLGLHYNLWSPLDDHYNHQVGSADLGFRGQVGASPSNMTRQALSLSLNSSSCQAQTISPVNGNIGSGSSSVHSVILGSKYLKAAQELLDQVVNVRSNSAAKEKTVKTNGESMTTPSATAETSTSKQGGAEVSTAQRQELQLKKAKLATMLDEVEQRYRQYQQHMHTVTTWFEQAAGLGSAKSYTALALKTISKQFRCLKEAIGSQIKAASKSLGEEADQCLGVKINNINDNQGSRLRFVDHHHHHHLRHQLGFNNIHIQHNNNAWRPQRGLPERAVSVLRAWLFEHFLHPYPKTADKVMLAKQTGLTRSQVSNWFINARVRLWKPMVEEMYMEETKDQLDHPKGTNTSTTSQSENKINKSEASNKESSSSAADHHHHRNFTNQLQMINNHSADHHHPTDQISNSSLSSASPIVGGISSFQSQSAGGGFNVIAGPSEIQAIISTSQKKPRTNTTTAPNSEVVENSPSSTILSMDHHHMEIMKASEHMSCSSSSRENNNDNNNNNHHHLHLHQGLFGRSESTYPLMGFGTYPLGDLGRFQSSDDDDHQLLAPRLFHGTNNGVSLTLGLPHCENYQQQTNNNTNNNNSNNMHSIPLGKPTTQSTAAGYDNSNNNVDMQSRKRFAAQLLPDFVT